ncbi:hypothetical protein, partial [Arcobacter sp. YIC-464]|uniref:hypothetical protein n=1 Tax=Arcobacter sp. YIC-464 TaxID=3376631 RepID=UPI003C2CA235
GNHLNTDVDTMNVTVANDTVYLTEKDAITVNIDKLLGEVKATTLTVNANEIGEIGNHLNTDVDTMNVTVANDTVYLTEKDAITVNIDKLLGEVKATTLTVNANEIGEIGNHLNTDVDTMNVTVANDTVYLTEKDAITVNIDKLLGEVKATELTVNANEIGEIGNHLNTDVDTMNVTVANDTVYLTEKDAITVNIDKLLGEVKATTLTVNANEIGEIGNHLNTDVDTMNVTVANDTVYLTEKDAITVNIDKLLGEVKATTLTVNANEIGEIGNHLNTDVDTMNVTVANDTVYLTEKDAITVNIDKLLGEVKATDLTVNANSVGSATSYLNTEVEVLNAEVNTDIYLEEKDDLQIGTVNATNMKVISNSNIENKDTTSLVKVDKLTIDALNVNLNTEIKTINANVVNDITINEKDNLFGTIIAEDLILDVAFSTLLTDVETITVNSSDSVYVTQIDDV